MAIFKRSYSTELGLINRSLIFLISIHSSDSISSWSSQGNGKLVQCPTIDDWHKFQIHWGSISNFRPIYLLIYKTQEETPCHLPSATITHSLGHHNRRRYSDRAEEWLRLPQALKLNQQIKGSSDNRHKKTICRDFIAGMWYEKRKLGLQIIMSGCVTTTRLSKQIVNWIATRVSLWTTKWCLVCSWYAVREINCQKDLVAEPCQRNIISGISAESANQKYVCLQYFYSLFRDSVLVVCDISENRPSYL